MNRSILRLAILFLIASITMTVLVILVSATRSDAADIGSTSEPYGGCKEAWQAPYSAGADDCRALGWVVRHRVVVDGTGWVVVNRLRPCRNEDSGRCYWNAGVAGNKRGHSFVNLGTVNHPVVVYVKGFRR